VDRFPHQRVPITVELVGGHGTLRAISNHVGPDRVDIELGPDDVVPPGGTAVRFTAHVAGSEVKGDGHVRGARTIETPDGPLMVLELAVTALDPVATEYLRRSAFRDRVLRYAEKNPDGRRILQSADLAGPVAPTAPDTSPVREREGRWVDDPNPVLPRSERPRGEQGRKRPRPGRHTWELEDRFRSRG
jgi:hypothetical protein